MKTINNKIKQLRKKAGLTQDNLYPSNASQISLIESGKIKNPSEPVLREIAKNLEVAFDELIDDTSWSPIQAIDKNVAQYALSKHDLIYELGKDSMLKIKLKTYPRYDEHGNENRFCPRTGKALVVECPDCKRPITGGEALFCMGCGSSYSSSTNDKGECNDDESRYNYNVMFLAAKGEMIFVKELENLYWKDLNANHASQNKLEISIMQLDMKIDSMIQNFEEFYDEGAVTFRRDDLERERSHFKRILSELKRYELKIAEDYSNNGRHIDDSPLDGIAWELIDNIKESWIEFQYDENRKEEMLNLQSMVEKIVSYGLSKDDKQKDKILSEIVKETSQIKEPVDKENKSNNKSSKAETKKVNKKDKEV